ncbi:MAG: prepilin-type N-terminal cleavage/methylation domain-containing protein [Erysipelotrichales bacterium]|nr:prepilin-type N-terminal cleavage/methylation domain-containing protein [Erysipelotrichales bacterium]
MKNDEKGFTLVELLISLVIFAVVVTAVFSFMLAGTRSYSTVTNRLNLNVQSQLTLNQLDSYIADCNACLYFSGNKLYVVDQNADGTYTANLFELKADNCIYYGSGAASPYGSTGNFVCTVSSDELLAENITAFSVSPESPDGVNMVSAVVTVTFSNNSATISGTRTIALRNMPAVATVG